MAMRKVNVDGHTLNRRTAKMLTCAEGRLGYSLSVMQGSYNNTVGASAGTHDGGGALDVAPTSHPSDIVLALRQVGFAAWHRLPSQGPWPEHIHAIAIGDPEMSSGAALQVREYYAGQDGLAGSGEDNGPRLHPIPVWPIRIPDISLGRSVRQFKAKPENKRKVLAVRRIQRMLNKRMDANLAVDGIAGPVTQEAYRRWETKIGSPKSDGIPGQVSLSKLVAGYYHVVK